MGRLYLIIEDNGLHSSTANALAQFDPAPLEGKPSSFDIVLTDATTPTWEGTPLVAVFLPAEGTRPQWADFVLPAGLETGALRVTVEVMIRLQEERRLHAAAHHLARTLCHEVRSPMTGVSGFAELLSRGGEELEKETHDVYVNQIVEAADRLNEMVTKCQTYLRLNRSKARMQDVDLNITFRRAVRGLETPIRKYHAKVTTPGLPTTWGDEALLDTIFYHVILNGLIYTRKDAPPELVVRAREEREGGLTIEFVDNGIGVEEADRERIFEPFVRLHAHEEHAGSGLGLAIVRRAAELMGGEVALDGNPAGGAVVTVRLPTSGGANRQHGSI